MFNDAQRDAGAFRTPGAWRYNDTGRLERVYFRNRDPVVAKYPDLDEDALNVEVTRLLGVEEGVPESLDGLPSWLREADPEAQEARAAAENTANVARFVFVGILVVFIIVFVLSDIACRNRIGKAIAHAEVDGVGLEAR